MERFLFHGNSGSREKLPYMNNSFKASKVLKFLQIGQKVKVNYFWLIYIYLSKLAYVSSIFKHWKSKNNIRLVWFAVFKRLSILVLKTANMEDLVKVNILLEIINFLRCVKKVFSNFKIKFIVLVKIPVGLALSSGKSWKIHKQGREVTTPN